ncbi:alpha-1,2-fucosyltransferase [Helicobacter japonicus]|uniref:Alpha-1,2-fucosyltransferase n=1 Tax=Helicobacter japonicus TaxID=425400 RepID=A0A4U8TTL5_9HELI|nr:alpha-1,2-fucosyltransferase [Helicobacter japonicus]
MKQQVEHIRSLELTRFAISLPILRFCLPKPYSKDYYDLILTKIFSHLYHSHPFIKSLSRYFYTYDSPTLLTQFCAHKAFSPRTYFNGYFIHLQYFLEIEHILRKEFYPISLSKHTKALKNHIIATPKSTFLHIRRGDFYLDKHWEYVKLGSAYYNAALKALIKKINNPVIFIFSDDILWCKEHFTQYLDSMLYHQVEFVFVEGNDEGNAIEDLTLMRSCQNGIMANSTFSYWAAYLIDNPDKFICAPIRFNYNPRRYISHHIPHSWKRIDDVWGAQIN